MTVSLNQQKEPLHLLVVEGDGPSLFGRDWLMRLKLDWSQLNQVHTVDTLQEILQTHEAVFKDELGCVKDVEAKLHMDFPPKFCTARSVPFALRERVERELDRLVEEGVIEPVEHSEWASPLVPVVKEDGSIRVCGDYKQAVNKAIRLDSYPLPRIDDLLASLSGGVSFSKLDLAHAYQQIPLEEGSKKYTTLNTHKGLFQYNRLPFGISSAPAIFQRTMENILRGMDHVVVFIDDILVTGRNEAEHLKNLNEVLSRLERAGMRLKKRKCAFLLDSVEYLGHVVSAKGLEPSKKKIQAIIDAPVPQDVSQLKSFLGLVNYYGKFLANLSSTLAPLYQLLQKKTSWHWGKSQEEAFSRAKQQITSPTVLAHYDPDKELRLSCDASPYGVGAVLSQMEDGEERPVAFSSRTLAVTEKKMFPAGQGGISYCVWG